MVSPNKDSVSVCTVVHEGESPTCATIMVYNLTLSDIPEKDICQQNLSHVKAIGFWRKERIIIITKK